MRARASVQIFGTLVAFLAFLLVPCNNLVDASPALNVFQPRQGGSAAPAPAAGTTTPGQASTAAAPTSNNTPTPTSTTQAQPTTTSPTPTSAAAQQTTTPKDTESTSTSNAQTTQPPHPSTVTSALVTTNQGGQVVTSVIVVADTPSSSTSPSQTSGPGGNNPPGGSSGISSSTIIGLSVAAGVAVLCVIGFFVWKFTRKRIGEFDNNEEIKWPELNAHDTAVPLPTNRTGGAGFDTAPEVRRSSVGYAPSTAANSTAELHPDPYAIPPLPHLDPSQPYRDDPNARFYDPYRGPVPQTFEQANPGEVIPMTQFAGRPSPGPGAVLGGEYGVSPGPHAAYGGPDIGGRASPAPPPHYAVDIGGRASPAPRAPYSGGVSPGPQAAYGNVYTPQ